MTSKAIKYVEELNKLIKIMDRFDQRLKFKSPLFKKHYPYEVNLIGEHSHKLILALEESRRNVYKQDLDLENGRLSRSNESINQTVQ